MSSPRCLGCEAYDDMPCICLENSLEERDVEIATLKAEVERNKITISALQRSLDVVGKSWNEMDEMWTRERERSDKLRVALSKIADPRLRDHKEPDAYTELGCVMNIAEQALLAAKQDGGKE